ncbi:MAG: YbjN domain-containing protein [Deltaproteobacteria bacterium]|nr:YbjN domain-containing protein [Deltaproteobacteria bacterium]
MGSAIDKAEKLIEQVIEELGMKPKESRMPGAGGTTWRVTRGSAAVFVSLNPGRGGEAPRLRIVSPLVRLPEHVPAAMLTRLLELNGTELPGLSFGIIRDKVVLVAERSVVGLDRNEAAELLQAVGIYGDKYDDFLVREFGGTRVCDLG